MSEKILNTRIIHKHDTEANWLKATNFIPKQGEFIIYDVDANHNYERIKIGDGVTLVSSLPFVDAGTLSGAFLSTSLNSSDIEIPTSKAVLDALASKSDSGHTHDNRYYTESEVDDKLDLKANVSDVTTNFNESIIGLSVDGQVVTYIKGDGSVHTFETQDTNTTYSLATDEVTGLTKLYATIGNAEDGTMTQKAIKTELDKKVGVSIDETQNTLVFTK